MKSSFKTAVLFPYSWHFHVQGLTDMKENLVGGNDTICIIHHAISHQEVSTDVRLLNIKDKMQSHKQTKQLWQEHQQ